MRKTLLPTLLYIGVALTSLATSSPARATSLAATDGDEGKGWRASFSLQTDWHLARRAEDTSSGRLSGITHLEGTLRQKHLELGARLEEKQHPLPGREEEKGWGLPYVYARGRYAGWDLTLGDIYEQFGSGLLFRSYEDRALGLDNSVRGVRLNYTYGELLRLKALTGQARHFFDRGTRIFSRQRGFLSGGDLEVSLEHLLPQLRERGGSLQLGGGILDKQEAEDELAQVQGGTIHYLRQPTHTFAWSARGVLSLPTLSLNLEYAYKDYDPNRTNGFIFRPGSVAMLTATYLWGRSSLFVGARRSDNFDFRSDRQAEGNALRVNFLQPFTKQQTYTLAALYPYATQPNGEWSFQTAFDTSFADRKAGGKRRRTSLKVYASLAMGLNKSWLVAEGQANPLAPQLMGSDGYRADFFGMKELLFREVGIEVSRKVSADYSFVLGYTNQAYNQRALEGHALGGDIVHSQIFLYDGRHRLSSKLTLRTELQYLHSRQASGDWLYGSVECSILPHFILSASDLWNVSQGGEHYYMLAASGIWTSHSLRLSYGRTRAGVNCSGGVCRYLPETHGLYLSYHLTL